MSADLTAQFLTNDFEKIAVDTFDFHNVRDKCGIQLDGKTGRQIDSEMIMRNQDDAAGWQSLHQRFADEFGIWVVQRLGGDLPNLRIRRADGLANCVKLRAPTCDQSRGRNPG